MGYLLAVVAVEVLNELNHDEELLAWYHNHQTTCFPCRYSLVGSYYWTKPDDIVPFWLFRADKPPRKLRAGTLVC